MLLEKSVVFIFVWYVAQVKFCIYIMLITYLPIASNRNLCVDYAESNIPFDK